MIRQLVLITVFWTGMWSAWAWGQTALQPLSPTSKPASEAYLAWYDANQLAVEGKGWTDTAEFWHRLPGRAKGTVPPAVWGLSTNTAGLAVRFVTDAPRIAARWTLTSSNLAMPHMPATGVSGLDLYVRHEGQWRWTGAGRPGSTIANEAVLVDRAPPGEHEYMLYLPLYNGIKSLEIGIPDRSSLMKPAARERKPIVVYGTSICQGGCASRPGMAHIAILGRRLDRPTINLGFSGSGKMEPAMADLLAELDPAVYVLDCLPNMTAEMVAERVEPFVDRLRNARPNTTIVLTGQAPPQAGTFLPGPRELVAAKNRRLREVFDRLTAEDIVNLTLTYVPGDRLLGSDDDATVDGTHATDLGFARMADTLEPVLRQIIEK
jgi:lysophospholipase L1-like esterase